jgi:hypothetical protein
MRSSGAHYFINSKLTALIMVFSIVPGFVGLNLVQSAFTNWWPMMTFLRKLGVRP